MTIRVIIIVLVIFTTLSCRRSVVAFTLPVHSRSKCYSETAQLSSFSLFRSAYSASASPLTHFRLTSNAPPTDKTAVGRPKLYAHRTNGSFVSAGRSTMIFTSSIVAFMMTLSAFAIDANRDISGQDWSNSNYEQQDFSGVVAAGTNFQKSNLQGCNFNGAILTNADLTGADIRGASFKDSVLDGTILKDANAVKATFSASILDVESLENADLTDSLWPSKLQIMICDMPSLKGTSSNGVNTRDSILCSI